MSVDENKMIFKKYLKKIKKNTLIKFLVKIGIYLKKKINLKVNQINL